MHNLQVKLIGHSFASPYSMMMNSSSFESPKSYFFGHYLKKQQFSTFKIRNLVLKSTNLLHKWGFDNSKSSTTVLTLRMEETQPLQLILQEQGLEIEAKF